MRPGHGNEVINVEIMFVNILLVYGLPTSTGDIAAAAAFLNGCG